MYVLNFKNFQGQIGQSVKLARGLIIHIFNIREREGLIRDPNPQQLCGHHIILPPP